MGVSHVKRVDNRLQLILVVDLHCAVYIELALNKVLVKERGEILPLRGCDFWGRQPNKEFVLGGALNFGFCCQQLTVINE